MVWCRADKGQFRGNGRFKKKLGAGKKMPAHPTPTNVPLARSNVILQKHNSANYAKKKLGHFQIDVPVRQFCSLAYWQNPEDKKQGR